MCRFLLLLFLISLVWGCSTTAPVTHQNPRTVQNLYFSDPGREYLYRADISFNAHRKNGILVARRINDSTHRVVLATDFGNTLMDIEVGPRHYKINRLEKSLDRPVARRTLLKDFRLLFASECFAANATDTSFECVLSAGESAFVTLNSRGLLEILASGRQKNPTVRIAFEAENDTFARKITLFHGRIPLVIELLTLDQ